MNPAERQTRSTLMSLFQQHGFHPRTDLGQNFLIDLNLIEYILESAELCRDDVVLEIGTGTGGLTTALASRAGAVVSVEVDHRVFALAEQVVSHLSNVRLLNCDALKNKMGTSIQIKRKSGHESSAPVKASLPSDQISRARPATASTSTITQGIMASRNTGR